ncbi:MAG: hypothetical protein ACOY3Y_20735, partial [Acidobacteriota bacterium]
MRSHVLAVAVLALCAASEAPCGQPTDVPLARGIAVDGDPADWKDVPLRYLESGPRVTAVARDDTFLYVHFRFSDLDLARRVTRTGAIVWFGVSGEHGQDLGLRFRGSEIARRALREMDGAPGASARPPSERAGPAGPPGGGLPERAKLGALEVLRAGAVEEVIESGARPNGPAAACGVADGVFAYEFRIPLAELAGSSDGSTPAWAGPLAVGFQMGGLTRTEREAMRERFRSGGGPVGGPGGG